MLKGIIFKVVNQGIANFALAFAEGSVQRFCFYIFHQPKMPEDVMKLSVSDK